MERLPGSLTMFGPGLEILHWRAASGQALKPPGAFSEPFATPTVKGCLKRKLPVELGKLYFITEYKYFKSLDGSLQRA